MYLTCLIAIAYLTVCGLVGAFARSKRNRSGFLWFWIANAFTPVAVFPALVAIKPNERPNTWANQSYTKAVAIAATAFWVVFPWVPDFVVVWLPVLLLILLAVALIAQRLGLVKFA